MIENYGLFWKRRGVYFGEQGPNRPTQLFGEISVNREKHIVDLSEQIGIYCLYDQNFSLLYAGKAGGGKGTILKRLRDHIGDNLAERWSIFSWFGLKPVLEKDGEYVLGDVNREDWDESSLISSLEGVLLLGAEPPLNRQGANFGGGSKKFSQVWDSRRDPPQASMISEIYRSLQNK